tara:strand:+ start:2363 stop:2767 length:405 start_codon:yes stop_codon:yes gene_type:complete
LKKIEHIGIAVRNLEDSNNIFRKILGKPQYKEEIIDSENVKTSFYKIGSDKIELVSDIEQNGIISNFIDKRGEGIHHIAIHVDDIYNEIDRIEKEGIRVINKEPKIGADNKLICFLHPKDTNGVLIELCQEINQ